jgi:hypothetical protein
MWAREALIVVLAIPPIALFWGIYALVRLNGRNRNESEPDPEDGAEFPGEY